MIFKPFVAVLLWFLICRIDIVSGRILDGEYKTSHGHDEGIRNIGSMSRMLINSIQVGSNTRNNYSNGNINRNKNCTGNSNCNSSDNNSNNRLGKMT